MPGWILVANRSLLFTAFRENGGVLSAVASLVCLFVLAGCSNLRQQTLDLPIPVLPSQAAVEADQVITPVLPLSEASEVVAGSSVETGSALDSAAFENDFAESEFERGPSVQSFLPSENSFQPPQQRARFVGVLDKAEMSEIKLKAVSNEAAPAPAIANTSVDSDVEDCETPEVCSTNMTAQCDCCKKKKLPRLAAVDPVDPELLPALFGSGRLKGESKVLAPGRSMLQPLRLSNIKPEPNAKLPTKVASNANTNLPIRLTAMQDSEILQARLPSLAAPAPVQNKAQLLIPVSPAVSKELKAEAELATGQMTDALKANPVIKVSPIMDLNSAVEETPTATVAMATANETVDSSEVTNKTQTEFIPVSSSGIRVSAIPFKAISLSPSKPTNVAPTRVATKIDVEPAEPVVLKTIVEPTPTVKPTEVAKVVQTVEPKVSEAEAFVAPSKASSSDFASLLTNPVKALPVVAADFPVAKTESVARKFAVAIPEAKLVSADPVQVDQVEVASMRAEPIPVEGTEVGEEEIGPFVATPPSANIDPLDPLADLDSLPDMSQIEQQLAEFEKANTFDPSTVIQEDRMDPAVLLAKLDGPFKTIAAPVPEIVDPAPDKDLITQQLAAQSSALLELQDAIKQLKPKPVKVVHEDSKLTLNNAAFCTKISGFGQFKPFAANTFSGSQKTLLYCEVENQTSKQFTSLDGSPQFETVLRGSIVIYDSNEEVVQAVEFPAIKDIARQQRRDFYVYFPVQFNELASGDYRLELSVEDVAGNETAVLRPFMRFSVK